MQNSFLNGLRLYFSHILKAVLTIDALKVFGSRKFLRNAEKHIFIYWIKLKTEKTIERVKEIILHERNSVHIPMYCWERKKREKKVCLESNIDRWVNRKREKNYELGNKESGRRKKILRYFFSRNKPYNVTVAMQHHAWICSDKSFGKAIALRLIGR